MILSVENFSPHDKKNFVCKKNITFNYSLSSARTILQDMADATTFVTCLSSSVRTVLQDMSYFIAVITSGLVAILGAVPASQNVR